MKTTSQKVNQNEKAESYIQMKGQDKTPEKQPSEVEISNLPEKEFIIMIMKMIQGLRKRMEANIEKMQMFAKDLEELKNRDEQYTRRNQQQNN